AVAAACSRSTGVTVVVDFASLGGGTQTRCASGDPSSGLAALRATGHTTTRAAQEPGYFLCRIDGKPANDPCQRTSPADAYWSYWHAKPGGTWTYSDLGPADYDPAPGTVEGWAFGAGKPPSSPPPRPAPAEPSPAAATHAASPAAAAAASAAAAPAATSATPQVAARTSAAPSVPSASPAAAASGSSVARATSAPLAVAASPSSDPNSVDIKRTMRTFFVPWSVLVVLVVLLLLLTGAGVQVVRRRRESNG
ncbi:MAG: hypothetical protein QOJ79_1886, partial [Actinomycetota bacterium]|nr:hypothetical protein [Actinomycetota bacterium]